MTNILVEYGKHGETFWPASTDEEWAKSSLAILTYRWEQGYWYDEDNENYKNIENTVKNRDLSWITYKSGRTEPEAWRLLDIRSDYEYERVELERLQDPDKILNAAKV